MRFVHRTGLAHQKEPLARARLVRRCKALRHDAFQTEFTGGIESFFAICLDMPHVLNATLAARQQL
jgi:hypothetical protein